MKLQGTIITAMLSILLLACNNVNDTKKTVDNITPVPNVNTHLNVFENIEHVRSSLSSVGIGTLGEWKEDGMGGYMSITSYYQIEGDNSSMPNNLAYYLESTKSDKIESIKLVFNLNNSEAKILAIEKYKDVALQTFKKLDIPFSKELQNAIFNLKEYSAQIDNVQIIHTLQQSNIKTWVLTIKPV